MSWLCFCFLFLFLVSLLSVNHAIDWKRELETLQKREEEKLKGKKECPHTTIDDIFSRLHSDTRHQDNVLSSTMVTTPCLNSNSFGNSLSDYVEIRVCSNITGYNFVAIGMESFMKDSSPDNPFLFLPNVIYNPFVDMKMKFEKMRSVCKCTNICHEHEYALWHHNPRMVRDILRPIFQHHYLVNMKNQHGHDLSASWRTHINNPYRNIDSLPLVPDVAIHYRCGDNIVGHYGYLAFPAFTRRIPANSSTIYVMSESPSRKPGKLIESRCNAILGGLFNHLKRQFPSATILVLRGANIYDDMTRIALARTAICSVSSFCIWPALASSTSAYFPITRLIAKATAPTYTSNFHWLDKFPEESVLPGVKAKSMNTDRILQQLTNPKGFRPTPPSYVLDRMKSLNSNN